MARPQKCRCICSIPGTTGFLPEGSTPNGTVTIGYDEYEVIRLLDYVQTYSGRVCEEDGYIPSYRYENL